jgi:hypothetical protein
MNKQHHKKRVNYDQRLRQFEDEVRKLRETINSLRQEVEELESENEGNCLFLLTTEYTGISKLIRSQVYFLKLYINITTITRLLLQIPCISCIQRLINRQLQFVLYDHL